MFLGIPYIDDEFFRLIFRFAINGVFLLLIVQGVYYRNSGRKDYLFTYCMVNVLVFFICFALKKLELQTGIALALFAIFGILRYRTDAIPIREMTYLFIVIGLAVINALSGQQMSYAEMAFTNGSIVGLAAFLEALPLLKHEVREVVLYEKIEMLRPENHEALIADLETRTGLNISRIELGQIDFLRDTVAISVFYYPQEQSQQSSVNVTRRVRRR